MSKIVPGPGFGRGSLESSGGGGHDGGMSDLPARVERLEKDVAEVKAILGRMEPVLASMRNDMSELKGRAAAMPTMWQLLTMVLAIIAVMGIFLNVTLGRVDRVESRIESATNRLAPNQPSK